MKSIHDLEKLAKLLRYYSLVSTTEAGSGHPSSSLSAADLMAVLMYGGFFRFDLENLDYFNNDRLIFSKGHAAPLFYALWAVGGQTPSLTLPAKGERESAGSSPLMGEAGGSGLKRALEPEELLSLRKFGSRLEGHPTMEFPFTEVPTGSLGQGLSVGVGMALNAKLDKLDYRTFVLLGDSEMAEGSVWEAMASASHYQLNNLAAILDVNRLGQRGETMHGHDTSAYQKKAEAFGWETMTIDGHDINEITSAFSWACGESKDGKFPISNAEFLNKPQTQNPKPKIIIAKTLKGKGVSFIEDKDGWHGKPLSREELEKALAELGEVDKTIVGEVARPRCVTSPQPSPISEREAEGRMRFTNYDASKSVATRKAYGNALANLVEADSRVVVLDAETSNSTYADAVKKNYPEKFVECFIAEQNMAGMALGFSRRGKIPFVSTFAAFFSRAFDQIRMSGLAKSNIKFIGSHAGVSIGEDGASQMGLEELAMFRTVLDSVVLYPSDAISTENLVFEAAKHFGNVYIQTTRKEMAIIYQAPHPNPLATRGEGKKKENSSPSRGEGREGVVHEFKIGGSCVLRSSDNDKATVIGAGVTLHEALAAYEELKKEGINIRVIDLYSIKPIDSSTLEKAARETKNIITVEDSYPEGGIGEAVASALCSPSPLPVRRSPPKADEGGARGDVPNASEGQRGRNVVDSSISSSSTSSALKGIFSLPGEDGTKLHILAVRKMPRSGKPEELLAYEEIDRSAIIKKVTEILSLSSRT